MSREDKIQAEEAKLKRKAEEEEHKKLLQRKEDQFLNEFNSNAEDHSSPFMPFNEQDSLLDECNENGDQILEGVRKIFEENPDGSMLQESSFENTSLLDSPINESSYESTSRENTSQKNLQKNTLQKSSLCESPLRGSSLCERSQPQSSGTNAKGHRKTGGKVPRSCFIRSTEDKENHIHIDIERRHSPLKLRSPIKPRSPLKPHYRSTFRRMESSNSLRSSSPSKPKKTKTVVSSGTPHCSNCHVKDTEISRLKCQLNAYRQEISRLDHVVKTGHYIGKTKLYSSFLLLI